MNKTKLVLASSLLIFLAACGSSGTSGDGTALPAGTPVTVQVGAAVAGAGQLNPAFVGLSLEKSQMSSGLFSAANTSLVTLFKNLGPGVLRIGGSSVDQTAWDNSGDANGQGMTAGYVAPADVDQLTAFVNATGWKVIYGINFATETTAQMASEASYVAGKLGVSLYGFELGNEPDLYSRNGIRSSTYTFSDFVSEWNTDASTVLANVPGAVFTGPAASYNYKNYTVPFAADESTAIDLLTQHYYINSSCANASTNYAPSIALMLTPDPSLPSELQALVSAASTNGVSNGARMAETNSFYSCTDTSGNHLSGVPGVSNAFASALWAIDFMFANARYGMSGINFHTGGSAYYSPIQTTKNTVSSVQPEYYGLWLFSQAVSAGQGALLETTVSASQSGLAINAYAIQAQDGSQVVVLLNESGSAADIQITNLQSGATNATLTALTAPSLSDTAGSDVKANGASFNTDGSWTTPPVTSSQPVAGGSLTVYLPAGTALLVKVQ
jgi:hypothetical protein